MTCRLYPVEVLLHLGCIQQLCPHHGAPEVLMERELSLCHASVWCPGLQWRQGAAHIAPQPGIREKQGRQLDPSAHPSQLRNGPLCPHWKMLLNLELRKIFQFPGIEPHMNIKTKISFLKLEL